MSKPRGNPIMQGMQRRADALGEAVTDADKFMDTFEKSDDVTKPAVEKALNRAAARVEKSKRAASRVFGSEKSFLKGMGHMFNAGMNSVDFVLPKTSVDKALSDAKATYETPAIKKSGVTRNRSKGT